MTRFRSIAYAAFFSVVAVLAGCKGSGQEERRASEPAESAARGPVSLTIDFGELRQNVTISVDPEPDMTVLDLLLQAADQNELDVEYDGSGETAFVRSIGGIEGGTDGRGWWIFHVNEKLADQGSGVFQLQGGDQVRWHLGEYKESN